MFNIDQGS